MTEMTTFNVKGVTHSAFQFIVVFLQAMDLLFCQSTLFTVEKSSKHPNVSYIAEKNVNETFRS